MNLVGKIFTVLIFVMCVVFATFALMVNAAHKNWKVEAISKNDELTKANKEKASLAEEKKNLETALADQKEQTKKRLIALEQVAKDAVAERNDKDQKLSAAEGKVRELALAIQETTKHISVLQTAVTGMRDDLKVAVDERNSLQKKLIDTTDSLTNAVAERERLQRLHRELAAQIVNMKELLQYSKVTENDKAKFPPKGLEGEVTSVPRPDVVEISVGADDGVRKGHQFVVTRPSTGKYIGIIEVIQVDFPNRAVCRPVKASLSDQIQRGDHVKATTKAG